MNRVHHTVHRAQHHFGWNNALPPVLTVAPGEIVEFDVMDASGGQLDRRSTATDVTKLDFARVNPTTGPIHIDGIEPGDTLVVEILELAGTGWGWTALIPGFGLLADQFPEPYLHVSHYDQRHVSFADGISLPLRPFPGTIGVALAERGTHSVVPPRHVGGNMDLRDLVAGSKLMLPVEVKGALFSVGDTHAAQGDGEVCGTAIETAMTVRLRFAIRKQARLRRPQVDLHRATPAIEGRVHLTCGVAPDLMQAARDAIFDMIDYLGAEYRLTPELAYCLCSVAVDLRMTEVVDAPNWMVCASLPCGIFR